MNRSAPPETHRALRQRIEDAVADVSYPAHQPTLIDTAARSGAARDVMEALQLLPDEAFGSLPEVSAFIAAARRLRHAPRGRIAR